MNSLRKIIAVLLAVSMVFAMSASVFAASYPDLEKHWAKTFMEDLVGRGMLAGYNDGTMKPEKDISGAEALVFFSNLYQLTDKEKAAIAEDYGDKAKSISDITWVQPFLGICLAAGIANEAELKALDMNKAISKEQLSLFLARAIQMDDAAAAMASADLSFADADQVAENCRGSVALLSQLKVVSGNTKNEFTPKANVTRAVVATMVSNALTYLEKSGIELEIAGYSGLSHVEGILASASTKGIAVKDETGVDHFYKIASGFTVTVDGSVKALSTSYVGDYIKVRLIDGVASGAEIENAAKTSYITGVIAYKDSKNENIRVNTYLTGESKYYNVMQAKVYLNGAETVMGKVEKDTYVAMKVVDGVITEVQANNKGAVVNGTITSVEFANPVVINMTEESGNVVTMSLLLSDLPRITRGNTEVGVDKLVAGDVVKVTYAGGRVSEISMDVTSATLSGSLTAISQTINGTTWVITKEDGTASANSLAKNVVAYSGKNTIKASQISVGDEISVVVIDGEITEVTLDKAHSGEGTSASEKIGVEVLNVDTSSRLIAALTSDSKLIYINCNGLGSILITATGRTVSLSSVSIGDKIVVYGSYNADGGFDAKSIIIEEKQ